MKKIIATALSALLVASSASVLAADVSTDPTSGLKYTTSQVEYKQFDGELKANPDSPYENHYLPSPAIFSEYTEPVRELAVDADVFVSTDGDDLLGDGSFENPFATLGRAQTKVRQIKASGLPDGGITVAVMAGAYQVTSPLSFDSSDSGSEGSVITYTAYGDGEVLVKGSLTLDPADFTEADDEMKSRLTADAAENVRMVDLKKYGITKSQLKLIQTGTDSYHGTNVELTMNKEGFTLARYPNDTMLYSYITAGRGSQAIFTVEDSIMDRVKSWASTDGVWGLTKPILEYNEATSPLEFDFENGQIIFTDVRSDRIEPDLPFYFFNVPEELDVAGEWYIDRDNCILYMYPIDTMEDAELELSIGYSEPFIEANDADYITFDGFSFVGTRGDGITMYDSDYVTIKNCIVNNIGSHGIVAEGYNNTIQGNTVSYTGKSGVVVSAGIKDTLTRSNILVDNNLITHWGLYKGTFYPAVNAKGQAVTVSHNELCDATGIAVDMGGNNHVLEYNLIHNCCTLASDSGAFYDGSSWTSGGIDIRYNAFYNIGTDKETPSAIYWDDGMAYQRAYGNLILNVSGHGFAIGGGFGQIVTGNLILNTGTIPCLYDGRPYYGNIGGDSFYSIGGFLWNLYKSTPYTNTPWSETFPLLSQILQTNRDKYAPHFAYNPAFSLFSDNIFVNEEEISYGIGVQHVWYSTFIDSYVTNSEGLSDIFVDWESGDYRIKEDSIVWETVRDFEEIPYHLMGRY